jgi:protease secretion system outer membrane protein
MKGAAAGANRAQEQLRDAEQQATLEVQRLWGLVSAGQRELEIRLSAIASAELSVDATEKSFKGGVRSQIDVLNSIQTLFQVQQEYVTAVLALSDNYLNLLLQAAVPADEAVTLVQAVLLP